MGDKLGKHQIVINAHSKEESEAIVKRILGIMPSLYNVIEIKEDKKGSRE
ncbi:hypothetical protein V7094_29145 [Priestia megaterium]